MESKVVVVKADREPMEGITNPGPHQIYRNPRVSVEKRELGELDPDEIRVEMIYAGLCGTDVHLVRANAETGYILCSAPAYIPSEGRVIGHEGVGKVVAVGSHVQHLKIGAYVTFESIIVCHYCDVCRKGEFNQCRNAKLLGLEKDGLFGTIVDVPGMLAHDITRFSGRHQGLKATACVEPAGVAYVACKNGHISPGDVVVVFGAGPIGLFSAILSENIFGASAVYIVEPIEFRRRLARKWSDHVYDIEEFFENHPKSIDVVIEASGYLNNVDKVFRNINANGYIVLLARSGVPLAINSVDHMITNEVSVVGSRGHLGGAFIKILNLYEAGRLPLDTLVTDIVSSPERLCEILNSPEKIINENCKILVRLNSLDTSTR